MPPAVYWAFPLAVLIAILSEISEINLTLKQRIFIGLAGLFNILMVFIIFFVVETPEGYHGIWGVQGRYFIPFFPLLIIPFMFKVRFPLNPAINAILVALISFVCAVVLFLDYHVVCGSSYHSSEVCRLPNYRNWDTSTFLGVHLDKDTRIRQNLVVQCEELSQIEIWVNENKSPAGQKVYFVLETMDWEPIFSTWIQSEDIPENGWMTVDIDPPIKMRNEEIQYEIIPKDGMGIPRLEFGYFPTNEYSRGVVWFNDVGTNSDMVFHYLCLDGLSSKKQ